MVSSEVAKALHQDGWKKVDLHVHSACPYDVPPAKAMRPQVLLENANAQRLDFVTLQTMIRSKLMICLVG